VAQFKVYYPGICLKRLGKSKLKPVRISGLWAEIQNMSSPNTNLFRVTATLSCSLTWFNEEGAEKWGW
jgi:hypothetical protein